MLFVRLLVVTTTNTNSNKIVQLGLVNDAILLLLNQTNIKRS